MREMKDSGVEWIGEIPEDWKVGRLKNVSNIYVGNSIKDSEKHNYEDSKDAIPYIATKEIDVNTSKVNYENGMYVKLEDKSFKRAKKDSILMCIEGGSAGRKIAFLKKEVAFVNKLCCFEAKDIYNKYLYYYLSSAAFKLSFEEHISGLIGGVSQEKLKSFFVCFPSNEEQQKIAQFLDNRVATIDNIIDKTKETIEDYKKYKQSLITEVVTKGLDKNAEMKDSGVEWIGKIPKSWGVGRVKDIFNRKNEKADEENPIVLSLTRSGVKIRDISTGEGQLAESYKNYNPVEIDDFLLNPMDLYSGANCSISKVRGVISPAYINLRAKEDNNPAYYDYYFKTQYWGMVLFSFGKGVSYENRWTLGLDTALNYFIPIPPIPEQQKIAQFLDKQCTAIDNLISAKQNIIDELEQYKKSLIYEYVTGKKEVR